jgi:hypothetical protein
VEGISPFEIFHGDMVKVPFAIITVTWIFFVIVLLSSLRFFECASKIRVYLSVYTGGNEYWNFVYLFALSPFFKIFSAIR